MSSVAIGSATTLLEEAHAGNDDTALLGNALIEASCCGRFDVVRRLLAHPLVDVRASWFGPSPPFWNADSHPSALRGAALGGHCQCVDLLLQHPNADPAAFDNEAIRFACENGHAGIVELLLAIPDVRDTVNPNHLLSLACRGSHSDVIRVLLDQVDIDLGADGFLALLHVCERGNDRVARQLLVRCKGSVNTSNTITLPLTQMMQATLDLVKPCFRASPWLPNRATSGKWPALAPPNSPADRMLN